MSKQTRALHGVARQLAAVEGVRGFRVTITPGRSETFGLTLEETFGETGTSITAHVITSTPVQVGRVVDALFAAVRSSGLAPSAIAFTRKQPIQLDEAAGVRLALVLLATQPITKHERARALVAGINAMSIEETYYWYSKCIGVDANRARRALRTLLADA